MSSYVAHVSWQRGDAVVTDNRYSRAHTWQFDGGLTLPAAASPHVVPAALTSAAAVDPEEAFVAALSSCHMLWFLSLAAKSGYRVDRYEDKAKGVMAKNTQGKLAMTTVTLRPQVSFGGDRAPDEAALAALHHRAHEECFIAQSVRSDVRIEPR